MSEEVQTEQVTEQIETESTEVVETSNEQPSEVKKPSKRLSDRFSKLTGERNEYADQLMLERKATRELRERLERLEKTFEKPIRKEDFKDEGEFVRTLTRQEIERTAREAHEMTAKEMEAQSKAQQEQLRHMSKLAEQIDAKASSIPDIIEAVQNSQAPMTPALFAEMANSEYGAEIAYYLSKNPKEASNIASLDGKALERKILKLELGIESGAIKLGQAEIKKVSSSTSQGGGNGKLNKDPNTMTDDEYHAWRSGKNKG